MTPNIIARNTAEQFGVGEQSPPRAEWKKDYKVSTSATQRGAIITLDVLPAFPFYKIYGVVRFPNASGYLFRAELLFKFKGQTLISLPVELGDNTTLAPGDFTVSVLQRSSSGATFGTDYILVAADTVAPSACIPKKLIAVADKVVLNVTNATGLGGVYSCVLCVEQSTHAFP